MDLWSCVNQYKTTDSKKANLTSIKGGKWNIPFENVNELYKQIINAHNQDEVLPPFAEKIGDQHPLIFDIDIKYNDSFTTRQFGLYCLQQVTEFLWASVRDVIEMDDITAFNEAYVMTKSKPYPCKKGDYKSKDGIHIVFPKIIIDKSAYKVLCGFIRDKQNTMFEIFKGNCDNPPSNLDDTLFDGCFTRWMPYLCHKEGEEPYVLEEVFTLSLTTAERKNPELVSGPMSFYTPDVIIKELSMIRSGIKVNVSYTDTVKNKLKSKAKKQSSMVVESESKEVYYVDHNNIINPHKIVEEEELKLISRLCDCLSVNRATVYGDWLNVGLALYNTNPDKFLPVWEKFSMKYSKYANGSTKRDCSKKWESFKNSNTGNPVTAGSIRYWAKEDDPEMYNRILIDSLDIQIKNSVSHGPDAHHLIGLVIQKYYQDQFLCVDISDDWYFFNGVRWKKTLKANELKRRIHKDIYNIYYEYEHKFKLESNKEQDPDEKDKWVKKQSKCLTFMQKLLQENYVNTLIGALRHLFYKENIAEEFDSNVNLLGLENCVIDLKEWVVREGRPEDYITKTTGFDLPIGDAELPINLTDINTHLSCVIPGYTRYRHDLDTFIKQIIPIDQVRNYTMRFLSKCLSGENRDEGFYIWTGSGGNGKSKLIELTQMVLGEYACGLPVSLITSKRASSNSATPEMERTKGVRLVVMQEPEADENINIGLMKELTGNDKIIARGLYKEPVEFNPQFKLLLMCNDLPSIPSNDDGTWRRLEVVDFISKFVAEGDYDKLDDSRHIYKRDKEMRNKLPAWKLIFFGLLLEEWMEYDIKGIQIPDEVNSKTKSYRNANNDVARWIEDFCEIGENVLKNGVPRAPTSIGTLVDDFEDWAKENGCKVKKNKVKEEFLKWQKESSFGLSIGKLMKDGCPNGTKKKPLINLLIIEDDDEDDE